MPEREEPDMDRVREALRQHDEREQAQEDDEASSDEPPEPEEGDESP
jgi:hypothetical protein